MSKLIIFTDGGSRGNPGPAACGAVIKNEAGKIILKSSKYIGKATNNQAEYEALILVLEKVKEINKSKQTKVNIDCFLDSELVVKQLNREYKMKNEGLKPLFIKVNNLISEFNSVKFFHIPREKNKLADKLVNQELDAQIK
ncbi:MAG: ribonuclease HI family protein [Patescibacteria group bacterium]|nr:ribonuclease HI family protein [Patescibacteria group bacterium]